MEHKKVLITRIFPAIGEKMLKEAGFEVTCWNEDYPMTQDQLITKAKEHDAIFCTITEKIDQHFFNECPSIKVVSQFAVGYDNIDIAAATRLGIPVGYTPEVLSEATADTAFGLMIATARKMTFLHKTIAKGDWSFFKPTAFLGMELSNKTLGVYGLGRIGMAMARRCRGAYNMQIIYNNRKPNAIAEKELQATYVSFDELLKQSDVLSVHCALTPETTGVFNKEAFGKMKNSSIFINTSRGMVHNEIDLLEALTLKQIWGAGLDVTNPEPMQPNNPLLDMENVTILPHIGSASAEARDKMAKLAATNIIEFFKHKRMIHAVNPEVL